AVCEGLGLPLMRAALAGLPTQAGELDDVTRLWQREVALEPRGLYVDAQELDGRLGSLQRLLARVDGIVFCAVRDHHPDVGRQSEAHDVAKPTRGEQQACWHSLLGDSAGDDPPRLAGQFNLNLTHIAHIAHEALRDGAEDGGAVLCFDEADALFGKRSEVKDSHDRYANIETDYLLQRLEAFGGLAILTTNMKSALDQAFMRRLRFIVSFPFPGQKERETIWRGVFPSPDLAGGDVDFARLAELHLTGA